MSQPITIPNFEPANIKEWSNIAVAVAASSTTTTLFNNDNIAANDYMLLGRPGSETGELQQVASVSGVTIVTTDPLSFDHEYNADVTILRSNQFKIFRASNVNGSVPDDAAFSVIDTIDIDIGKVETTYIDPTGSDSFWYKSARFNSTTNEMAPLSESQAVRGGNAGNYTTVEDVRKEAGFEHNLNITSATVYQCIIDAQAYINGKLNGIYVVPFSDPVNPFISKLAKVLAAGYLQIIQYDGSYGMPANGTSDNEKIKWVEEKLKQLVDGSLTLVNPDGTVPTQPPSGNGNGDRGFSGYPNRNTPQNEPRMFEVQSIVGFNSRDY
jgi:hypothetical protein